jgi:AcrR family transcriptional regulator
MVSPRKRLTAAERRERILVAASELFGRKGYGQVSMAEVAAAAGVTNPIVYDHFVSKRDLYAELLGRQTERLLEATTALPRDGTLEDAVRGGIGAFFAFVEEHPGAWRMLFRDAPGDLEVDEAHRAVQAQATDRLAEAFGARAGALRTPAGISEDQARAVVAELAKSALNGLAGWWWSHRDVERAAVERLSFDLLWPGIARLTRES